MAVWVVCFIYFFSKMVKERRGEKKVQKYNIFLVKRFKTGEEKGCSYRFAHLLLPLEDVWHGILAGKLDVTVENDAVAENGCDVNGILTWKLRTREEEERSIIVKMIKIQIRRRRLLLEKM